MRSPSSLARSASGTTTSSAAPSRSHSSRPSSTTPGTGRKKLHQPPLPDDGPRLIAPLGALLPPRIWIEPRYLGLTLAEEAGLLHEAGAEFSEGAEQDVYLVQRVLDVELGVDVKLAVD